MSTGEIGPANMELFEYYAQFSDPVLLNDTDPFLLSIVNDTFSDPQWWGWLSTRDYFIASLWAAAPPGGVDGIGWFEQEFEMAFQIEGMWVNVPPPGPEPNPIPGPPTLLLLLPALNIFCLDSHYPQLKRIVSSKETYGNDNMTETLIGIAIGTAVTWYVADLYYRKAAGEQVYESAELKRLNTLLLLSMEHQGWIRINYNSQGDIAGFEQAIEGKGTDSLEAGTPGIGGG